MARIRSAPSCALLAALLLAPRPGAAAALDQKQEASTTNFVAGGAPSVLVLQTFTPGVTGRLDAIEHGN